VTQEEDREKKNGIVEFEPDKTSNVRHCSTSFLEQNEHRQAKGGLDLTQNDSFENGRGWKTIRIAIETRNVKHHRRVL
jgi:hypothetical protein